jgi:serine/threonine protein kinase
MAIDDPIAFAPPPAFGPFRVLHQIGIGALGPVFRTYEPTRDRLVAVKVFRLDITPEQAQVLADELTQASEAGLFHPSIVEPIAAGVEGTVAYRAEEYVAAESLDAAIRHYAPASLDTALPFLTQLAGAVDFARTAGIGHGALHLRDIFVTPEEARASGFGVVEALERVGLRAPVRRPYSAPERVAGEQWSTPADVFSLAAITYELLTGRRPAGTGDQMGPFMGEHLLEFGAGMRLVLERAMHDQPARRYPSALAFASALEAAARGGRVTEAVMAVGEIAGGVTAAESPSVPVVPLTPDPATHMPVPATPPPVPAALAPGLALSGAAAVDRSDKTSDEPDDLPLAAHDTAESAYSDISDERDDDAAHYELARAHGDEPTLFDEEAAADHGLEPSHEPDHTTAPPPAPPPLWDEDSGAARSAPSRLSQERNTGRYDGSIDSGAVAYPADDAETSSDDERPRPAVLPIAVTLILGLLIGFAAGYWAGGREPDVRTRAAAAPAASAPAPSEPARDRTPAAPAKRAGQAYSEQAVQPPSTPPAIPDEGPRTTAAPTPKTSAAGGARPAAPAATTGRITVTSTPSGAAVTVNDRWRGRTPLTLDKLKFGDYSVRVVLRGFSVGREDVALSQSEPSSNVAVRLQRQAAAAPPPPVRPGPRPGVPVRNAEARPARPALGSAFTGSVFVDSRPQGARIVIDGKMVGTTPARIPEVTIGSHVVRLELAEHRAWTVATRVAAGEETRVTGSLERIP